MNAEERRAFVERHRTCVFGYQRKEGPPSAPSLPKLRVAGSNPVSRSKIHAASHALSGLAVLRLGIRVAPTWEHQLGMAS
jgi:hypothetical protein